MDEPAAGRGIILTTTTGELFLPTRIIYRVHDREELLRILRRLRCVGFDERRRRWTWNYEFEARDMGFPPAYDAVPPARRPLLLASCYEVQPDRMHVYVRSGLRLTKFLMFFDVHVPRACAEGEFFDEHNLATVHDPAKGMPMPEDYFRDESRIAFLDVDEIASDPARARLLMDTRRILEPLERHRLTAFYEDGEEHMTGAMKLREVLAMKQHQSDEPIRPFDVILEMMKKSAPAADEAVQRGPAATSASGDWARLADEELVQRLFTEADQLPLEFAREVVSRGERMIPRLAEVARFPCNWHKSDAGWCAVVHAVFLMGAIGGEAAAGPLLDALRLAVEYENSLAVEALPPIFGGLGPGTLPALRAIALDAGAGWTLRTTAMDAMAAVALRRPETDAEVFGFIGRIASDEKEHKELRALAGMILLHCSRREHEALLRRLVDSGIAEELYDKEDVRKGMLLAHVVHFRFDWMGFYQPDRVLERRRRCERERLSGRQAWREAVSGEWGIDPDSQGPCDAHEAQAGPLGSGVPGADVAAGRAERRRLLEAAVADRRRVLGEEYFKEHAGHFWGLVEGRPYLRACASLADLLMESEEFEAAVVQCREMLRLDPKDNLNCVSLLLIALAAMGRFEEVEVLLNGPEHRADPGMEWPWMRALAAFVREGPSPEAERLVREALGRNRHLPDYLLGLKDLPEKLPRAITPGGRDEAQLCTPALRIAWERVPGALHWLAGDHGFSGSGKVGRNEPCPCGSGKKFKKCCLGRTLGHA